jgi:hypothetical protein
MRCTASFRLYEELNEYLSSEKRKVSFDVTFKAYSTIGEAIVHSVFRPMRLTLFLSTANQFLSGISSMMAI